MISISGFNCFVGILFTFILWKSSNAVVCHDLCLGVIGCDKRQDACEGKYCTFYRYRDILKNPERVILKRSCSDKPFFTYGPNSQQFGVRNRCIRTSSGSDEWMLLICDSNDFCNTECNSSVKKSKNSPKSGASWLLTVMFFVYYLVVE